MKNRLSKPSFSSEELHALKVVFERGWVGPNGPEVEAFEKELADFLGGGVQVLATNSGTSALHLALILLGVGKGDIVIQQSYAYCAPAFAASYLGAKLVFVDSELDTWGMSPVALENALSDLKSKGELERVKVIIPVHVYGSPASMNEIKRIAESYNIPILEDAAEGIGGLYDNQSLGTIADVGVISFNANKIVSAGGGGALVTRKEGWLDRAKFLANQAKVSNMNYEHLEVGFNYSMNDITAAIARVQLAKLDDLLHRRNKTNYIYRQALEPYFDFQIQHSISAPNNWLTAILVDQLPKFIGSQSLLEIEFKTGFQPIHQYPIYQSEPYYGGESADMLARKVLLLPSGDGVKEKQVIEKIKDFYL